MIFLMQNYYVPQEMLMVIFKKQILPPCTHSSEALNNGPVRFIFLSYQQECV